MKRWIVLVVSLLLYATPVGAVTITSGTIGAWQGGDFGGAYDIHGDGFDLVRFMHGVNEPVSFAVYTSSGAYNQPRDLSNTAMLRFDLQGQIAWTIEPVTVSPTAPFTLTYASAPFTMTGALNGTAVDGVGTFTLGAQGHEGGWHTWSVNFTFDAPTNGLAPVPEPATLLLIGTGLVAAGVWHRRRRR